MVLFGNLINKNLIILFKIKLKKKLIYNHWKWINSVNNNYKKFSLMKIMDIWKILVKILDMNKINQSYKIEKVRNKF